MTLDTRWLRVALVAFALAVFLPGLTSLPPGDRDESRFAQATKQMTETGDYLRIMNGAEPRNKKPIGIHWLQAPFVLAAGKGLQNSIWPYRIPSVLGGVVAVLATFEAGATLFATPAIGAMAAMMLAGSVILAVETHIAKTDAALLGATTIVMALLARAYLSRPVRGWQAALFWLAMAAGILIKGPITPMVAGLAAIALVLADRRAAWLRALRPGWGVPLMLAAVAPWFVAIGVATHGAFFAQAVGGDLGHKLAGGAESHGGFPGLHLLLLPLLAFPSTIPVLRGLPAAWRSRRDPAVRYLLAWAVPSWAVFELVPTKLPHYTLPLYPALFLLAAFAWLGPARLAAPRWMRHLSQAAIVLAALVLGGGALALPLVLHQDWWLGMPAAAAVALTVWFAWRNHQLAALLLVPALYGAILAFELPRLPPLWIAPRVEAVLRAHWPGWTPLGRGLVSAGYAEPSLMFLCGTDTVFVPNGAEAADRLSADRGAAVVSQQDIPAFAAEALRIGINPDRIGEVSGFNYSRGRFVTLDVFTTGAKER